ncbi:MAG: NAD(P)/FAD-dependent oxidoreductase [Anaerolineaceae bacterium]|nr:NAD(P)/FAD-dependent oxidoreductase [Anaerolineaceae bacterium]MDD4042774.1 NAD(P)/FAD-dependent oxidoreductase [Anaerolineaceae bacterium]MDD4577371.1 NAD(P)/FAD-dependent oxidoreductase [Anaerolineaceae bacterium]
MKYDAIVVGGGISGLTAAAFLAKAGQKVLLCEKESRCGGLVNSFERDGFVYDGGIRALEDSGVLFPMLRSLGIELDFEKNHISLGVENHVIRVNSEEDVDNYQALLTNLYPESREEITEIVRQIRKIMHYMDVQYGIDNPIFLDFKEDAAYFGKVILPWMVKYAITAPKIAALNEPVVDFLKKFSQNQSLLDIISQHFFHATPAFFALSYLKLYIDYYYPLGGTGVFPAKLVSFIEEHHGEIRTNTKISSLDPTNKVLTDEKGNRWEYERLIWAADLKTLYKIINPAEIPDNKFSQAFTARKEELRGMTGNDSILSLFLGVNLPKEYFSNIATEHFFYTPSKAGQTQAGEIPATAERETVKNWLDKYFALTTYEISCPVLRDPALAPANKTGLIVSVLFDYQLTKAIELAGWYEEFKSYCETQMIATLSNSIYPGLSEAVIHQFSSTPLTIESYSGNFQGAITGWALDNDPIPAESRIPKIMNAVKTPIPGIYQAGQWTYSPSGLPISLLTGKIAADQVIKDLRKRK